MSREANRDQPPICTGVIAPDVEGNAACGPIGIMTGPPTCAGSVVTCCC